jgi:hypothetical protein
MTVAAFAVVMLPAPASAATGDTVAAAWTPGSLTVTATPCTPRKPLPSSIPSGPGHVVFFSVSDGGGMSGTWVAGTNPSMPYIGFVQFTDLLACVSAIGNPPPQVGDYLLNQGSFGGATYSDDTNFLNKLPSGVINPGGTYIQAGLVVVAAFTTSYTVTNAAGASASATNVPLLAVLSVQPYGSILGPPNANLVAGPVVSTGPGS